MSKYTLLQTTIIAPGAGKAMMFVSVPPELPSQGLFLTTDPKCAIRFKDRSAAGDWLWANESAQDMGLKGIEYDADDCAEESDEDTVPVIYANIGEPDCEPGYIEALAKQISEMPSIEEPPGRDPEPFI